MMNKILLLIIWSLCLSFNVFSQVYILESTEDTIYKSVQENYPDIGSFIDHPNFKKIDIHNVLKQELDTVLIALKNYIENYTTIWYVAFVNENGYIDKLFISFPKNINSVVKDKIFNHFKNNLSRIKTFNSLNKSYEIAIPGSIRKLH